jgi:hypothetical protein
LKDLAVVAKTRPFKDIKKYMKKYKQDGELKGPYDSSSEESDVDEDGQNISQYKKNKLALKQREQEMRDDEQRVAKMINNVRKAK